MATKQFREFDKWLSKDTCSLKSYPNMNHREVCIAEDAWKAALECVKDKCEQLYDICCLDCGCFSMVQNKIDEELDDDTLREG